MVLIYLTSFFGSSLWDLFSPAVDRLYKSWNIMTRINFDLPRNSKTFFIEPVSETAHLKSQLMKRFTKFYKTMKTCEKPHVKFLLKIQENDHRSTFGQNVINICREAGVEHIEQVDTSKFTYSAVPEDQEWKISLIKELLEMRSGRLEANLTLKELNQIIDEISV